VITGDQSPGNKKILAVNIPSASLKINRNKADFHKGYMAVIYKVTVGVFIYAE